MALAISADRGEREAIATAIAAAWAAHHPGAVSVTAPRAVDWPFTYPLRLELPASPVVVWMPDIHEAFVNHQTAGTRLVTTQAPYVMHVWLEVVDERNALLLASADQASLEQHAPEVLTRRGPFADTFTCSAAEYPALAQTCARAMRLASAKGRESSLLPAAIRADDPAERLALCVKALDQERTVPTLLATASACMEVNDLDAAARDLDEALAVAPDCAAAHFEQGKLWLRRDDMARAGESYRAAARLMPNFSSAWANLGATLGELDRPEEALIAFREALRTDPSSHQALNNVGVVNRELGNLADSEAAFRRVTELAPDLAFGYYNLGHTLFLQGRYHAALSAYVAGQKRDAERNPVQASRLALCRLAAGDASGALEELQRATRGLPPDYKRQLVADANAIAWALLTHRPELAGWKQVNDWLTTELTR